ncbi:MAG: hypothetical protein LBH19_07925 [Dysgonamonadaceae bacterium]|jgi:hypothetical protein|nr:hypothetical protein [Dysgonamonadaceae bacterium]
MKAKTLKIALTAMCAVSLMAGCGSSKKVSVLDKKAMAKNNAQSFTIMEDLPCRGMDSTADYIVVNGEGRSSDRPMAKDKALLNALENLASKLAGVASKETDRVAIDRNDEAVSKTVNMGKQIADANVSGYRVACEKFVVYEDGKFGCFVTLEYGKQKLVQEMYDGLQKNKILKMDYEFDKYMKQFNEDLKEYEQSNK